MNLTRSIICLSLAVTASLYAGTLPEVLSVKVTNTRADWFYIEELEILNTDGVDVASLDFGTTVEVSEDAAFGSVPDGAIDDVVGEACCASGFHSSSSAGEQSFTITFPSAQTITGKIRVWNRQDGCCGERLDGMRFEYFLDANGTGDLIGGQEINDLALESTDIGTEVGATFEVTNPDTDADGDGLTNRYETDNGLDPNDGTGDNGADGDFDMDGSTNTEEFARETKPNVADTDADGLVDGAETGTGSWVSDSDTGTDPLNADTDDDSLLDGVETNTGAFADQANTGTNPLLADSDADGIADGRELEFGTDPNDAESKPAIRVAISGVKSVRITNSQVGWFYLEELDLRNLADEDVASVDFGTTAVASEIPGFGGRAEGPIDDVFGNCCGTGYHSSTEEGEQMLTFTFPAPQDLMGDIRVWNRQDGCCLERLDAMLFEFFDGAEGTGKLLADQLVEGIGTEWADEINSVQGAAVPLVEVAPSGPVSITQVVLGQPDALTVGWQSNSGEFFAVDRSRDLSVWEEVTASMAAASEGDETLLVLDGVSQASATFYRVRRGERPAFLEAGFEDDAAGWSAGVSDNPFPNGGVTVFELGAPTTGPAAPHSGSQVYGAGLSSTYDEDLNITLISPVIDLTNERRATLTFWYVLGSGDGEGARLEIIDEDNPEVTLVQTDVFEVVEDWTLAEFDLARFGSTDLSLVGKRIRLRFQFLTDSSPDNNGTGFYLDDVLVEK